VGRAAAVGIPVWLVLLFLLPFTGMGALACMTIATFLSFGVVAWADRRHERRGRAGGESPAGAPAAHAPKRPMSPLAAAGLTLGGVVVLAYVLFIVVTAARGN
jgi:uncharacterized iron-regulated membrane protein